MEEQEKQKQRIKNNHIVGKLLIMAGVLLPFLMWINDAPKVEMTTIIILGTINIILGTYIYFCEKTKQKEVNKK